MTLRLAQITDCHFTSRPGELLHGIDADATLDRVLDLLRQWQPDHLLITGDLSDQGAPSSYRRLRKALSNIAVPINVIPGNHDSKDNLARHFLAGQIRMEPRIKTPHWDLLMLDSALADHNDGHLDSGQLDRLRDQLQQSPNRPKLVFVHHHPLPTGDQWLDCMRLKNADALWSILTAAQGVKALVCGHIHQVMESEKLGIRMLSTPSTCSQARPGQTRFVDDDLGPGFRWFELADDGSWDTGVIRILESALNVGS